MTVRPEPCTPSSARYRLVSLFVALAIGAGAVMSNGCAKSEVVRSTGPHTPTTPEQVKIYPKAPKKYEVLGTVTVPIGGDVRWDDRGDADAGFERLKAEAAKLGANGLLLEAPPGASEARVLAGYKGTYYQVPVKLNPRTAVAQAIWVVEEK